jgi:nicotinamidase-related amidase
MAYARWSRTPVLTCVDTHRPHDIGDNYVLAAGDGSPVERMLPGTLLPRHRVVESDNCLSMSLDVLVQTQQAIFTKVHKDPFTNPKFDRLLTEMPTRRFVVFGVPLESTLRLLVLGLIMRGRRVLLIEDACGFFRDAEAAMTLRQLSVKGAQVQTATEYVRESMMQLTQRRVRRRRRDVA